MIDIQKLRGHTRGPWGFDLKRVQRCVTAPSGGEVCHTPGDDPRCDEGTDEANARLIAAAPELLAEVVKLRKEVVALRNRGRIEPETKYRIVCESDKIETPVRHITLSRKVVTLCGLVPYLTLNGDWPERSSWMDEATCEHCLVAMAELEGIA